MQVTGYSVYDDADCAVLASALFRLTKGSFGSLRVFVKGSHLVFPVSSVERNYLKAVIASLMRLGLKPGPSEIVSELFRGFAEAVCSRGGWAWQAYFLSETPEQKANQLYGVATRAQPSQGGA